MTLTFEEVAPELPTLVGDDVLGRAPGVTDRSNQKSLNVTSRWMIAEDSEADHGAGVVIEHSTDPPTKWPRLGQGERDPRNPEAGASGYIS